jgi:hypothetical protein
MAETFREIFTAVDPMGDHCDSVEVSADIDERARKPSWRYEEMKKIT